MGNLTNLLEAVRDQPPRGFGFWVESSGTGPRREGPSPRERPPSKHPPNPPIEPPPTPTERPRRDPPPALPPEHFPPQEPPTEQPDTPPRPPRKAERAEHRVLARPCALPLKSTVADCATRRLLTAPPACAPLLLSVPGLLAMRPPGSEPMTPPGAELFVLDPQPASRNPLLSKWLDRALVGHYD